MRQSSLELAAAATEPHAVVLSAVGLAKSYNGIPALRGTDFELREGEVHALLGQNGAGKSTFIKLLGGVAHRDAGSLELGGTPVWFRTSLESRAAGIAIVYQELSLVPQLTVAANLFLGRELRNRLGTIQKRRMDQQSQDFFDEIGFPLDPSARVEDLPFAYRQMTEIAKALMLDARVLVLDEPTSALSDGEEEVLFSAVRKVQRKGVGVVYVTHRLQEVFDLSQRVTVFRDGANAGSFNTSDVDMPGLVSAIVGPKRSELAAATLGAQAGAPTVTAARTIGTSPALELRAVSNERLHGVNLTAFPGEIVGFAGQLGSGRTEILETVFGLRRVTAGELAVRGERARFRDPADAIARGIGLAPEDRHREGLVLEHSIEHNIAQARLPQLTRGGFFMRKASERRSAEAIQELSIKTPNSRTPASALSGGNQQKVVFAKWRDPRCDVLLLDEPTVGVDVGAREEIYRVTRNAAEQGTAVIVASSDFAELLLLCDRICIVRDGRVDESHPRDSFEGEEQLHAIVNGARAQEADQ